MDPQILASIGLMFIAVAVATGSAVWWLTDPQDTRRRLAQATSAPSTATRSQSVFGDAPSPLATHVRKLVPKSPRDMSRIQRMMVSAGYHSEWAPIAFALLQYLLPAATVALGVWRFGQSGTVLLFSALAAVLVYFVPTLWLGHRIELRRTEIRNGLPDAIDLLIVCIEAGSGMDQALMRVGEELALAYPALSRELEMITTEIRAGKPRLEAMKNFAERTKVDDVRSLVAMLVQTDRFGTSVGQALRTHADTSRTKRRQRAEEKAAKLGVKLLFPLVFCLFPAFYLVIIGPSMLQIFRQLVWGFAAR
jgi:tight adherence protein C